MRKEHEHKIRRKGVTDHDTSMQIARKAREARKAGADKKADEQPTAEAEKGPRRRLLQGLGIDPDTMEVKKGAEPEPWVHPLRKSADLPKNWPAR